MNKILATTLIFVSGMSGAVLPAFAQINVNVGTGVGASVTGSANVGSVQVQLISRAETRANEEIDRRIDGLNALSARLNAAQRLSATTKASLSATISTQISALNDLKVKIAADADANNVTALRADLQSIAQSYRIFALIMPKIAIETAADREMTIAQLLADLSVKLQAKITEAQAAGNNVTAAQTALTDLKSNIADANVQAQAAITAVANLTPDNGDQTTLRANVTAMQDARAKIVAGQRALALARGDAGRIVGALAAMNISVNASARATGSATGSASY